MKMHGLGNDFVVVDERATGAAGRRGPRARLGDRHRGVGFDQLAADPRPCGGGRGARVLERRRQHGGGLRQRHPLRRRLGDGAAGGRRTDLAHRARHAAGRGRGRRPHGVNMGAPLLDWDDDAAGAGGGYAAPAARRRSGRDRHGQPALHLLRRGRRGGRTSPAFGARTNITRSFPSAPTSRSRIWSAPDHLRMRVWERGVGITLACGSSSCAAAVAAARRGPDGPGGAHRPRRRHARDRLARRRRLDDRPDRACLRRGAGDDRPQALRADPVEPRLPPQRLRGGGDAGAGRTRPGLATRSSSTPAP